MSTDEEAPVSLPLQLRFLEDAKNVVLRKDLFEPGGLAKYEYGESYIIFDADGHQQLRLHEHSGIVRRILMRGSRRFRMRFLNLENEELPIVFDRHPGARNSGQLLGVDEILVKLSDGTVIGTVQRRNTLLKRSFVLLGADCKPKLFVQVPYITWEKCLDTVFKTSGGSLSLGRIVRQVSEGVTHYVIVFPQDLSVLYKLSLLATAIFIDFVFYK